MYLRDMPASQLPRCADELHPCCFCCDSLDALTRRTTHSHAPVTCTCEVRKPTPRSSARGEKAVKALLSDPQLKAAKALKEDGGLATIIFNILDISHENSIHSFKDLVKKKHPDGIDILINNAGIFMEALGKILKWPY